MAELARLVVPSCVSGGVQIFLYEVEVAPIDPLLGLPSPVHTCVCGPSSTEARLRRRGRRRRQRHIDIHSIPIFPLRHALCWSHGGRRAGCICMCSIYFDFRATSFSLYEWLRAAMQGTLSASATASARLLFVPSRAQLESRIVHAEEKQGRRQQPPAEWQRPSASSPQAIRWLSLRPQRPSRVGAPRAPYAFLGPRAHRR